MATIVRAAVATGASRDRGTTRIGHLELLAALCPLAESVIGKQCRDPVAAYRYDASLFVGDMRARVEPATGTAMVGCGRLGSGAARAGSPAALSSGTVGHGSDAAQDSTVLTADGVRLRVRSAAALRGFTRGAGDRGVPARSVLT